MRLNRHLQILALTALLLQIFPPAQRALAEGEADKQVDFPRQLWMDVEESQPLFLAEDLLNEQGVPSDDRLGALRMRIKVKQQPGIYKYMYHGGVMPECQPTKYDRSQGSAQHTLDLADLILDSPSAFIGTVRQISTGWNVWRDEVATLAYFHVEEILHEGEESLTPPVGTLVGVAFSGGSIQVEGVTICDEIEPGFTLPVVAERWLITGVGWETNQSFFAKSEAFPVKGDAVLSRPYPELKEGADNELLTNIRQLVDLAPNSGSRNDQ